MPSTIETPSSNRAKLTLTLTAADLKPHLDRAYRAISAQMNIPGFRKGKVPAAIIDQRLGKGAVLQEAINEILPTAISAAITEHDVKPLGQPEVDFATDIQEWKQGEDIVVVAELDTVPEFDLPDVSQVKAEVESAEVTDADVDERIETLRERFATYADVERAAAKGDVVTVDLVAKQDGQELDDASADGVSFKLGTGAMIEGLDEAVTGLKVGESATFHSTLVGGASKDQEADIEVTVKKIQEATLPPLDDDFAQLVSQFDTVDEMRADLREAVERMALANQANQAKDKVLELLVKQLDFELPTGIVEAEKNGRRENIQAQLAQINMSLEKYLEEQENGRDVDDFWAEVDARAVEGIKAQLLLDKFADERDVQVDQQDLTEYLFRRAQANGTSPEAEAQHMMEHHHISEWMGELRRTKALGLLVAQAEVVDTNGKQLDLSILIANRDETPEPPAMAEQEAAETSTQESAKA